MKENSFPATLPDLDTHTKHTHPSFLSLSLTHTHHTHTHTQSLISLSHTHISHISLSVSHHTFLTHTHTHTHTCMHTRTHACTHTHKLTQAYMGGNSLTEQLLHFSTAFFTGLGSSVIITAPKPAILLLRVDPKLRTRL